MSQPWTNQIEIKSQSSSRVYVVSERLINGQPSGLWGCSCPAWKRRRYCKHLTSMGKPSWVSDNAIGTRPSLAPSSGSFSDLAYSHYDTSTGFGSPEEWIRQAEEKARGRSRYQRPSTPFRHAHTQSDDLLVMGLDAMPSDVKELVRAMRLKARVLHPDMGGDPVKFNEMFLAYERLLAYYPKKAS